MSKFTPGPWAVHPAKAQVVATRGIPICSLLWPTEERSEKETEANADLIASAPEMYAALKSVCEHDASGGVVYSFDEIVAMARAAIAKAEGRE